MKIMHSKFEIANNLFSKIAVRLILFSFVFIMHTKSKSQTPGNVGTGLHLWLKANAGITTAGVNVTAWADQDLPVTAVTVNGSPDLVPIGFNFNPYVNFTVSSGTGGDYLKVNDVNLRSLFWVARLNNTARVSTHLATYDDVTWSAPCGFCALHGGAGGGTARYFESGYGSGNFQAPGMWRKNGDATGIVFNSPHTGNYDIVSVLGGSAAPTNAFMGGQNGPAWARNRDWLGPVGEIIAYTGAVTAAEANRIESYLGIKYGITLGGNASTTLFYTSSVGTNVWAAATGYHHDVAGISRDDNSALDQRQSASINAGNNLTMGLGAIAVSNIANSTSFTVDQSFLIWGHNNAPMTETIIDLPTTSAACPNKRLEREWRVQKTNFSQNVQLQLDLGISYSTFPLSNFRLMIDEDGDGNFTTGTVSYYSPTSFTSNILTFDNVPFDIDNNGIDIFTLNTNYNTNPIIAAVISPTTASVCPGTTISLNGNPSGGAGVYTTHTWSGTGAAFLVTGATTSSPDFSCSTPGTYTLIYTVTDSNNCSITTAPITITIGTTPVLTSGSPLNLDCATTSGNISVTSSITSVGYAWSPTVVSGGTTSSATVNTAGTYTVVVTDIGSGCTSSTTVIVTNNTTAPNVTTGSTLNLDCVTSAGTISASSTTSGVTYSWSPAVVSGGTSATPTVNVAGTYTVTVTDPLNSCTSSATIAVISNITLPNLTTGGSLVLNCTTSSGTITASSSTTGVLYNWSPAVVSGGTTATPTINTAGTYTVTVTDPTNSCTNTATVSVTNNTTLPNITPGSSITLNCITTTGTISATSTTPGATYGWSPAVVSGGTTATPSVNTAGTYTVTVTDPTNGCTNTATVNVIADTVPSVIATSDSLFLTCSSPGDTIYVGSPLGVPSTYSWSPAVVSGGNTSAPYVNTPGTYTVTATYINGCTTTGTVVVTQSLLPNADAGNDVSITIGETTSLTAAGGTNYTWSNGETGNTIIVSPTETTIYCVYINDSIGCADTACVKVMVDFPCGKSNMGLPDAFTPNQDGINDAFCLQGWNTCVIEFNISIFDRWGEKVFESVDPNFCWDGIYKGKMFDPGVFVYFLNAKLLNNTEMNKKGNISLIR